MKKDEMINESKLFAKRLKSLVIYSWLFGALLISSVYAVHKLVDHLWTRDLPFGPHQTYSLALIVFAYAVMYFGGKRVLHLYYFFKFLLEMLMSDLTTMAILLHNITGGAQNIKIEDPKDIPDFIKNLNGKGPNKDTLH